MLDIDNIKAKANYGTSEKITLSVNNWEGGDVRLNQTVSDHCMLFYVMMTSRVHDLTYSIYQQPKKRADSYPGVGNS